MIKSINRVYIVIGLLVGIAFSSYFYFRLSRNGMEESEMQRKNDPCWFLGKTNSVDPAIHERDDRVVLGYPSDISLKKAVEIFNEEENCHSKEDVKVIITSDELISSLKSILQNNSNELSVSQTKILKDIITTETLPKGSLLIYEAFNFIQPAYSEDYPQNGYCVYLLYNLDNNPGGQLWGPEKEYFMVKKF